MEELFRSKRERERERERERLGERERDDKGERAVGEVLPEPSPKLYQNMHREGGLGERGDEREGEGVRWLLPLVMPSTGTLNV